jgi:MFS family permease
MIYSISPKLIWLGMVPLTSGLVGHIFGTRHMSMMFGLVFLGYQIGGILGAWLAGWAYDVFGSYNAIWWLVIALGILAAILHWPISERPLRSQVSTKILA